jgi:5-methylcytosine-specific restriction endonuclease McrA
MKSKKCYKCEEIKFIDAFSIKKSSKDGRCGICKKCDNEKAKKWYANNTEKSKLSRKKYKLENKEILTKKDAERYCLNRDAELEKRKAYYNKNKSIIINRSSEYQKKNRDVNRKAQKKHYVNNRDWYMALSASRRASKLNATPPWLTSMQKMQLQWFYAAAKMMSETSGVKHHVDHIHPLRGEGFSGLHVPWNLRVIKARENIAKNNNLPVEENHLRWEA